MTGPRAFQDPSEAPLQAVAGIRETARWAAAAFAGIGVAIAAGSQLSSIGSVQDPMRLVIAVTAAVFGLFFIVLGIWLTVDVLMPDPVTLSDLILAAQAPDRGLGKFLKEHPELFYGQAASAPELRARYEAKLNDRDEKFEAAAGGGDSDLNAAANKAEMEAVYLASVVSSLCAQATLASVRMKVRYWRVLITVVLVISGICMVIFAWAANPAVPKTSGYAAPASSAEDRPI